MRKRTNEKITQYIIIFVFCAIGCFSSYLLQHLYGLPNYLSSSIVGFIGSFLPKSTLYERKKLIASIYVGSFASMGDLKYINSNLEILNLCLLTGLCFSIFTNYFRGFGGKLGAIGFISSLIFIILRDIL